MIPIINCNMMIFLAAFLLLRSSVGDPCMLAYGVFICFWNAGVAIGG